MSDRPDIAAALAPGETLLWQGHPQPGRRVPVRATLIATALYAGTAVLLVIAWYLAIYRGDAPQTRLVAFGLIGTAAFLTYLGLRITLLDQRRTRARDSRTAYAVTDRRVLMLAGPYRAEVALGPGVSVSRSGDALTIIGPEARLRFERLDDAAHARDILLARMEGRT